LKKGLTLFSTYKKLENNATKALIDVLRFSDPIITEQFITECIGVPNFHNKMTRDNFYDILVETKLVYASGNGYILAITDERKLQPEKREDSQKKNGSIPDAVIQCGNVTILIESKVKSGKIDIMQLESHKDKFAKGEVVQPEPKFVSWQYIHDFFQNLQRDSGNTWNEVTRFLIDQYVVYCKDMGFIREKDSSYIYSQFNDHPRIQKLISQVDEYLTGLNRVSRRREITDCFGYVIEKRDGLPSRKFFSSSIKYGGAIYPTLFV